MDFFSTYVLAAIVEEVAPKQSFFRDRYFPTGDGDVFSCDKVLVEYKKGDRTMAAFVDDRAGDIPVGRKGFLVAEYEPSYVAPSRILTIDDLRKRGFGEALYPNVDKSQRATRILRNDMTDLDTLIRNREEWMCVQVMLNNACTMQTYIDADTQGDTKYVKFFDAASDHTYTVDSTKRWDDADGDIMGDVRAMCRMLTARGLPAADLVMGTDVADALMANAEIRELLNKTSGIITGEIRQQLTQWDGVVFMGILNFGGHMLNLFSVDETYVDASGATQHYFPTTSAMVTAPACGHLMYGAVTQIDYGSTEFTTYAKARVPKFVLDQDKDIRKIRLASRPLAAPKNYCPYIYAANVVS